MIKTKERLGADRMSEFRVVSQARCPVLTVHP